MEARRRGLRVTIYLALRQRVANNWSLIVPQGGTILKLINRPTDYLGIVFGIACLLYAGHVGQAAEATNSRVEVALDPYTEAFFKSSDLNRDASLTKREMRIFQDMLFSKADTDRDGRLSHGEIMAFLAPEAEKLDIKAPPTAGRPEIRSLPHERDRKKAGGFERAMVRLDKNGDGLLQKSEAPAGMNPLFEHYDADGNNALDIEELRQAQKSNAKWKSRMDFQNALAKYDTNRDGTVERSEAKGRVAKNFDKLDRNGDGFLDERDAPKRPRPQSSKSQAESQPTRESAEESENMM